MPERILHCKTLLDDRDDGQWEETVLVSACCVTCVCVSCDFIPMLILSLEVCKSWTEGRSAPIILSAVLTVAYF